MRAGLVASLLPIAHIPGYLKTFVRVPVRFRSESLYRRPVAVPQNCWVNAPKPSSYQKDCKVANLTLTTRQEIETLSGQ